MDFVEAVRLGCDRTVFGKTLFWRGDKNTKDCVLGAAFLGSLGPDADLSRLGTHGVLLRLEEIFPILSDKTRYECPQCAHSAIRYATIRGYLAVHLNDIHGWDRIETAKYIQNLGN